METTTQKPQESKTLAQEALELLEPVPHEKWITGMYRDGDCSCALGWWVRLKKADQLTVKTWYFDLSLDLRGHTQKYIREVYGKALSDISSINNLSVVINGYREEKIKDRVIHLLKDMVAAGY